MSADSLTIRRAKIWLLVRQRTGLAEALHACLHPAIVPPLQGVHGHPWRSLALAKLACFLALAGLMLHASPWNTSLFVAVNRWGGLPDQVWSWLNIYGLGASAFVLIASTDHTNRRRTAAFLGTLFVGGVLLHALKWTFGAPRPVAVLGLDAVHWVGQALHRQAMPSGHTATAFAVAALLQAGHRHLTPTTALFWALAAAVGVSRVASGAHWPADVLVGAGLGILAAQMALRLDARWRWHRHLRQPLGQLGIALMLVLVGLYLVMHDSGQALAQGLQVSIGALGVIDGLALAAALIGWLRHSERTVSARRTLPVIKVVG